MRHQDIHIGRTYLVFDGLVQVDARRRRLERAHFSFTCHYIARHLYHQQYRDLGHFTLGSRDFLYPMTLAEFEAEYGTPDQQRMNEHLDEMPNLLRSWDEHLSAA